TYAGEEASQIHNWIGKPGAWLAHIIISIFGATGYSLPALLLLWGIDRFRNGPHSPSRKIRIAGCIVFLVSIPTLLGTLTQAFRPEIVDEQLWRVSGAVGYILSKRLLLMGTMGALIVNLTIIAIALLLCTPLLFQEAFRQVKQFLFVREDEVEEAIEVEDEDSEEDRNGHFLRPLREGAFDGFAPPVINAEGYVEFEDDALPAIGFDSQEETPSFSNTTSHFDTHETDDRDLKIITKEEKPNMEELDLGVNLVETPTEDTYQLPPLSLMQMPENTRPEVHREEIIQKSETLEQTLKDFNIDVKVVEVNYGPTITCYELEPAPGIKISRIENLVNDITRALRAHNVRIVAPIPGKGTVGVEVPNENRSDVFMRELIACEPYRKCKSKLKIGLGKTISGEPFVFDLSKAPHILVAGATGSGKSVCINSFITSILYNAAPHEVKLLLVDPKQVELALYKDIPHLLSPVVTDPQKAGAALRWAVDEMEQRYRFLKKAGVRNIKEFNKKRMAQQKGEMAETETSSMLPGFLPYIVIIIDELADLMMVARADVEAAIARLAAMARAVGIHLVLATQRPSVDVLTGVIKNNFPSRIAFQVSSTTDSRTILDTKGAESLMGRGDMLFHPGGANKPWRLQGSFITTEEVEDVCDFVKEQQEVEYVQEEFELPEEKENKDNDGFGDDERDELYDEALQVVLENDAASTSLLQRRLKIGYGRAARLLDLMEDNGVVGPPRGSKPRQVIMNNPM
ncbi:hypothetical protein GF373_12205, partial [bacterium]|nr:hypothetical protein [bacterium]